VTTIATDGHTMAADGQTTCENRAVNFTTKKIHRLKDGRIVGYCGDSGDDGLFIEWLEKGGKKPKTNSTFIVLDPDGPPRIYFHDLTSTEITPPYSIGTGSAFALAAMDCGKSPEEAVTLASMRDIYTGGVIMAYHLDLPTRLQVAA
jgi:ATP-dependent protease HslVU (ClpYQ) peptidase subunit